MSTRFDDENPPLTDWISQAEAARIRGVSRQAIHKLVQSGQLGSLKVGGHVLVSRRDVESFGLQRVARPAPAEPSIEERVRQLLSRCDPRARMEILRTLRSEMAPHPLEARLGIEADVILDALDRAGDLTLRMFRGVIAQAAFDIYVVRHLSGWTTDPIAGDPPFDFLLRDAAGPVSVQIKLQRSEKGRPMGAPKRFLPGMYIVETQRTRGGKDKSSGELTRPYRFGEFDVLAVSMQPTAGRWDAFLYTVSDWLLPSPTNSANLATFQPVPKEPNEDWTDDFMTCIGWFRGQQKKKIAGLR